MEAGALARPLSPTGGALALGAALLPTLLAWGLVLRQEPGRRRRLAFAGTIALGLGVGATIQVLLRITQTFLSLEARSAPDDPVVLAFGFLLAAPLEQAALAAATLPALRSNHNDSEATALRMVLATVAGALLAKATLLGLDHGPSAILVVRAWTLSVGEASLACLWGFVLAVTRRRTLGGSGFAASWIAAVVFGASLDHLLFLRGDVALVAAVPLAVLAMSIALYLGRDAARRGDVGPKKRRRKFLRVETPSLAVLRDALRRSERPILFHWIAFGALVTVGVVTTTFAGSVALGHRLAVDFASVDRGSGIETAPPLVLLGAGFMSGFPVAGYLIARASRAATVLEPALAAGIAIVLFAVLLGAAAPVALVFAIAGAPIAFACACVGAWLGSAPR